MSIKSFLKTKLTKKDWKYFNYNAFPEEWDYHSPYHKYRICSNTGLIQEFEPHCLGLCPPKYTQDWVTLKGVKPVFKKSKDGFVIIGFKCEKTTVVSIVLNKKGE